MLIIEPQFIIDEGLVDYLNKRKFSQAFKKALRIAIEKWHKEILPSHFRREAYTKYRNSYVRQKKNGLPMVRKGQMRRSVLKKITISGTSKRASGKVIYGYPKPLSKKEIRSRTLGLVKYKKIDFKRAQSIVARSQGSYGKNRLQFELQISAMNQADIDLIQSWVVAYMVNENLEAKSKKGRRRSVKRLA